MKIDPNTLGLQQGIQSNPASSRQVEKLYGTRTESTGGSRPADGSEDQVQLSSLSYHLQMLSPESPERQARLEELSRQFESGKYQADSREVSRRMLDEVFG